MFVTPEKARLRLITQGDHARLAGQLFALWTKHGVLQHPRRAELIRAIREHDNGWREADSSPLIDDRTGQPCDLLSTPDGERLSIWQRGVQRYRSEDPYVALLTTLHAIQIHAERASESATWAEALSAWRELAADSMDAVGLSKAEAETDYRWLQLVDRISLTICQGQSEEGLELDSRHRGSFDGKIFRLEPFPLVGATTFRVPARWIDGRRYESTHDLATELTTRHWGVFEVRVAEFDARTS